MLGLNIIVEEYNRVKFWQGVVWTPVVIGRFFLVLIILKIIVYSILKEYN